MCVMAIAMIVISAVPVTCEEAGGQNDVRIGMSKEELLEIYHRGDIRKFERNGNEETFVFDDLSTFIPDDTITFHLVDGKVKSWDKKEVTFQDNERMRSALHPGITKEDLLKIYNIGNLKAYTRTGNEEIGTFHEILTSDPDDTITFRLVDGRVKSWSRSKMISLTSEELHKIFPLERRKAYARSGNAEGETYYNALTSDPNDTVTFYLVDGRVNSWEINTDASIAKVKLIDETMRAVKTKIESEDYKAKDDAGRAGAQADRTRVEADARSKANAEADFKERISRAKSDIDARTRAMEERSRYNNYTGSQPRQEDDITKTKQQKRASSVRDTGRYYGGRWY